MSGLYRVIEGAGPYDPASADAWQVIEPPALLGEDEDPRMWVEDIGAVYAAMEESFGAQKGSRVRAIIQTGDGEKVAESNVYTVGELE